MEPAHKSAPQHASNDIIFGMLLVKTFLAPSKIEGIGLFADQDIAKNTITWKFSPAFDSVFEIDKINKMPALLKDFIKSYASLSMISNKYILGNDNVRFTNHSTKPNLISKKIDGEIEKVAMTTRNIKKGEELTIDYRSFDKNDANSKRDYLQK